MMKLEYNIYFELSAIAFLIILALYMKLQYNLKLERNKVFFRLMLYALMADVLDVLTAVTISYGEVVPVWINMALNTVYFAENAVMGYLFYDYALMFQAKFKRQRKIRGFYKIVLVCDILLLVVSMFTGWVIWFDETGRYQHGPLYSLIYLVPYFFFGCSVVVMLRTLKEVDVRAKISIISYILISLSGALIQLLFLPKVLLNVFTISLAIIIILFLLETTEYQKLEKTLEELQKAKEEAEEAKRRAQDANQEKSAFLARMSHEIRTPINAVLGMDEMILRESKEKAILGYAQNIQSAGNALLATINDILDFSKIESGKMEIIPVEYDLRTLIHDCYQMISIRAAEKNLVLKVENDYNIPRKLFGDEVRIRQVISNLLTNAVKYTPEGTITLHIKWKEDNRKQMVLLVSVEDTGIGISEEDQAKLFGSFERVNQQENHGIEGTGLGLAITRQLLDLMGGTIGVISELGKGSLFYAEIPQKIISEEPIGDFNEPVEKNTENRMVYKEKFHAPDAKILVVDDSPINLEVMKGLLKQTRIQIDTVQSGTECLEITKNKKYHMIFMDHMMPDPDGIETLKRLRQMSENLNMDTPVVVLTANAISGAREEYKAAGFSDYVSKPAKGEVLEEIILKYLPEELVLAYTTLEG